MTDKPFQAAIRPIESGTVILDLHGEINATVDDELSKAYQEAEASGAQVIVLNFSKVDYINSTGIALIVSLLAQARKSHRELRVFGLSEHYAEIFRITRLADYMHMFEDENSALA